VPLVDDWRACLTGEATVALVIAPLAVGFAWPKAKLAFVTEAELYAGVVRHGKRDAAATRCRRDAARPLRGAHRRSVVHEEHGIGRYLGLVTMNLGEARPNSCSSSTPSDNLRSGRQPASHRAL
jgi:transcription-repair coupling factor (superfamily II helicase)